MRVDEYLDKLEVLLFNAIYMIFIYIVKIIRYIV